MENAGDAAGLNLDYDKGYELEFQMQVGSKLFPEYPIRSISESFSQLKKSVGILGSNFHSVSISPMQYRNDHFVIGIDTEKALGASYTGINTRAGDLLSVRVKAMDKDVLLNKNARPDVYCFKKRLYARNPRFWSSRFRLAQKTLICLTLFVMCEIHVKLKQ